MTQPWQIPLENAPFCKKNKGEFDPTLLIHYCKLDVHAQPSDDLQTSLMCEITKGNREPEIIQRLIAAGMSIARINLQNHDPEFCDQLIQSIRRAAYHYSVELGYAYPLAIIIDIRGPDIVTGVLKDGPGSVVELVENDIIRLSYDDIWKYSGTSDCLYIESDKLTDVLQGDVIYIDSLTPGKIKLTVMAVGEDSIECVIAMGGKIGSRMAVKFAQTPIDNTMKKKFFCDCLDSSPPTDSFENLQQQISWVLTSDVDAILMPNTQNVQEILEVKELLSKCNKKGKNVLVFACITSVLGYDNIDNILDEADGIYLDRAVLSMELPIEKICIAQKVLMAKCKMRGKPCICKAVINENIPTLCVSDIANLTLDGADIIALDLNYDSPLINFTRESVRMAEHCLLATAVICRHAERIAWQPRVYGRAEVLLGPIDHPSVAVCISALELAMRSQAVVIICLTNSGRAAKTLSRLRPPCPVIAVTKTCTTARQLRFWRSVRSVHYFQASSGSWPSEIESRVFTALDYCKAKRLLHAGDPYVIITGARRGSGYCDTIRLLYASSRDTATVESE